MLVATGLHFRRRGGNAATRNAGTLVLGAVTLQVLLGISVVWFGLPLWIATAHNGGAALLLLAVLNLNNAASRVTARRTYGQSYS